MILAKKRKNHGLLIEKLIDNNDIELYSLVHLYLWDEKTCIADEFDQYVEILYGKIPMHVLQVPSLPGVSGGRSQQSAGFAQDVMINGQTKHGAGQGVGATAGSGARTSRVGGWPQSGAGVSSSGAGIHSKAGMDSVGAGIHSKAGMDSAGARIHSKAGMDSVGAGTHSKAGMDSVGAGIHSKAGMDSVGAGIHSKAGMNSAGAGIHSKAGMDSVGAGIHSKAGMDSVGAGIHSKAGMDSAGAGIHSKAGMDSAGAGIHSKAGMDSVGAGTHSKAGMDSVGAGIHSKVGMDSVGAGIHSTAGMDSVGAGIHSTAGMDSVGAGTHSKVGMDSVGVGTHSKAGMDSVGAGIHSKVGMDSVGAGTHSKAGMDSAGAGTHSKAGMDSRTEISSLRSSAARAGAIAGVSGLGYLESGSVEQEPRVSYKDILSTSTAREIYRSILEGKSFEIIYDKVVRSEKSGFIIFSSYNLVGEGFMLIELLCRNNYYKNILHWISVPKNNVIVSLQSMLKSKNVFIRAIETSNYGLALVSACTLDYGDAFMSYRVRRGEEEEFIFIGLIRLGWYDLVYRLFSLLKMDENCWVQTDSQGDTLEQSLNKLLSDPVWSGDRIELRKIIKTVSLFPGNIYSQRENVLLREKAFIDIVCNHPETQKSIEELEGILRGGINVTVFSSPERPLFTVAIQKNCLHYVRLMYEYCPYVLFMSFSMHKYYAHDLSVNANKFPYNNIYYAIENSSLAMVDYIYRKSGVTLDLLPERPQEYALKHADIDKISYFLMQERAQCDNATFYEEVTRLRNCASRDDFFKKDLSKEIKDQARGFLNTIIRRDMDWEKYIKNILLEQEEADQAAISEVDALLLDTKITQKLFECAEAPPEDACHALWAKILLGERKEKIAEFLFESNRWRQIKWDAVENNGKTFIENLLSLGVRHRKIAVYLSYLPEVKQALKDTQTQERIFLEAQRNLKQYRGASVEHNMDPVCEQYA